MTSSELEKENAELKQQLAAFHAAIEREKKPDWQKWLKDLSDSLETEWDPGKSSCAEAARQLRHMADSFTLKANFVPSELRIKELEGNLAAAEKEHDDLIAKLERYAKALNKIAAWNEGNSVNCTFDEPESARTAREALGEQKL